MNTKKSNKTSIIICAYDKAPIARKITSTCIGNIEMYTDKEDYELILVDNEPQPKELDERYNILDNIDKHIINEKDIGYSASINLGVKKSDPSTKYLCFIHPDIFVWEGWLPKLRSYLENGEWDSIYPSQGPAHRHQVKRSYKKEGRLWTDAGLNFITREIFEKMNGLDERFETVYQEAALRNRLAMAGGRSHFTDQVIVTHIGFGTLSFSWDEKFQKRRGPEGKFLQETRKDLNKKNESK